MGEHMMKIIRKDEPKEVASKDKKQIDVEALKKYFNQKTFIGITAVGFLVVLVLYVFVFLNLQTKTEELEAANDVKQREVDELEEYYNNLPKYESEIKLMNEEIDEILKQYPADAREEDILMLAVDTQENNAIGYDSINMEPSEVVYDIPVETVRNADSEDYTEEIRFVRKHAIYVNTTTYADLKSVIHEIFASPNRIGIDNIVYTRNEESGVLEGSIDVYLYSASGTGKEYTVPEIKAYPAGTTDIFRTGSLSKEVRNNGEVQAE